MGKEHADKISRFRSWSRNMLFYGGLTKEE